jgi:hypothetical protein
VHDREGGRGAARRGAPRQVGRRARRPAPPPPPAAPAALAADAKPTAWWAKPAPAAPPAAAAAQPAARAAPQIGAEQPGRAGLARLARLLEGPVAIAREHRASDVLLSTGRTPRFRLDGRIEAIDVAIDDAELAACVAELGPNTDHGLEIAGTRLRVNAFDHLGGAAIAARLIRDRVPTLAELALPPELLTVVDHRDGLVLVCGPPAPASRPRSRRSSISSISGAPRT